MKWFSVRHTHIHCIDVMLMRCDVIYMCVCVDVSDVIRIAYASKDWANLFDLNEEENTRKDAFRSNSIHSHILLCSISFFATYSQQSFVSVSSSLTHVHTLLTLSLSCPNNHHVRTYLYTIESGIT